MKQKKKKALGSEMKFGVNTAAPFVGMKREEGNNYPFAKQVNSHLTRTCLQCGMIRTTVVAVPRILIVHNARRVLLLIYSGPPFLSRSEHTVVSVGIEAAHRHPPRFGS